MGIIKFVFSNPYEYGMQFYGSVQTALYFNHSYTSF